MKKLNSKAMQYIAKTYGRKFAGDEADPSLSEVPAPSSEQMDYLNSALAAPADTTMNASNAPAEKQVADASPDASAAAETLPGPSVVGNSESAPESIASYGPSGATGGWQSSAAAAPAPAITGEAPAAANPYQQAGVPDVEAGLQAEKTAGQAQAKAIADQGAQEVAGLKAFQEAFAKLPTANDIAQQYRQKDDELMKSYRDNKIDPNRYYHQMSTSGKVASGLGLILSGAGGALAHQAPMAQEMINKAIDRDIEAQKSDQSQSLNLWKMNRQQYGNDLAANLATQNQMLTGVKFKLAMAASSARGPLAQAQAQMHDAQIDQKIAENRFKLSLMKPTSDSFGIDPAKKVSWLVPPEKQQKVFDEIDAAQNTTKNASAILEAFDKAAQETSPTGALAHGNVSAFIPGMESPNQKAFHALLGPTFKDVEGTVRQAAMDNMFKNTTPSGFDFGSTKATKRAAVINYLMSKSAAPTASGFGINLGEYPSTNVKGAIPPAPGQAPQGPAVKTMNGVRYQQIQGGWKKIP